MGALGALGALAANIILPAFPSKASDLHASLGQLSGTLSSFFMVSGVGHLIVGPLSDRFGRRALVICGLVIFMASTVISATAPSLIWLSARADERYSQLPLGHPMPHQSVEAADAEPDCRPGLSNLFEFG